MGGMTRRLRTSIRPRRMGEKRCFKYMALTSSWQEKTDQCQDHPAKKGDERIQNPKIQQADDDEKPVALKADEKASKAARGQPDENLGAVERRDRDQVECGQHDVDLRQEIEQRRKHPRRRGLQETVQEECRERQERVRDNA